ncbi:hypothetical protein BO82DRAFT_115891 [Aspergillus uvarum CBS 121591]|uniref:Uncharacterized protein n=1 Tax=Aspergillus uvarum CBS 121591 TaxID=1448315 RepID=A0A319CLP8_9EURO|nr:hypothetical protein BO82DRAFT_115891 [Aspergillus uvarum CBS 121591]PYH86104.1 hypothetical protein BO82DRAFT_115891 [Aspergillus uvarum CBS 121591]
MENLRASYSLWQKTFGKRRMTSSFDELYTLMYPNEKYLYRTPPSPTNNYTLSHTVTNSPSRPKHAQVDLLNEATASIPPSLTLCSTTYTIPSTKASIHTGLATTGPTPSISAPEYIGKRCHPVAMNGGRRRHREVQLDSERVVCGR